MDKPLNYAQTVRAAEDLAELVKLDKERKLVVTGKTRIAIVTNARIAGLVEHDFKITQNGMIEQRATLKDEQGRAFLSPNTPEHADYVKELNALANDVAPLSAPFTKIPIEALADSGADAGVLLSLLALGIVTNTPAGESK